MPRSYLTDGQVLSAKDAVLMLVLQHGAIRRRDLVAAMVDSPVAQGSVDWAVHDLVRRGILVRTGWGDIALSAEVFA